MTTTTTPTQLTPCPGVFDDGNVFAILGKARRCLKRAGRRAEVEEMTAAATSGGSYDVSVGTVMRYVDDAPEEQDEADVDRFGQGSEDVAASYAQQYCDCGTASPCDCQYAIDLGAR